MSQLLAKHGLITLTALALLLSQLLLKVGIKGDPISITSVSDFYGLLHRILTTPLLLAGYAVSALVAVFWLVLLSRFELSYAAPMLTALYFFFLLCASYFVLREPMDIWRWLGTALLILGIVALSKSTV